MNFSNTRLLVRITPNTLTESVIAIEQLPNLTFKLDLGNQDVVEF